MRLLELNFIFRVEHANTDQVAVTFNSSEQTVSCTSFLYDGNVKERIYRTTIAPSNDYAWKLAKYFLTQMDEIPVR